MGSEYDGGLQIWRKRLWIWRKADGRRMEAHNILTPSPSLLTLALFGIFGTKLICFTFCEALHPARAQEKVLSILTWERSRWFDGISGRFDCIGYIPRISHSRSQWFLPTCGSAFFSTDNGPIQSLCITFEHFEALYIEYWTELCGHVPFLGTHPSGPMLISELNRDQISLMWDIIYGQININMCGDNICKKNQHRTKILSHIFCRFLFGWVLVGEELWCTWVGSCHIQLFIHFTGRKGLNTSKYVSRKSRKYGKSRAPRCRTKAFLRHSRVELSQLIPGRILCEEHVALL